MRIVFMGTPDFAAASLRALAEAGHELCGVFTQPDRPAGRGNKLTPCPVKQLALERGVPVYQFEKIRRREGRGADCRCRLWQNSAGVGSANPALRLYQCPFVAVARSARRGPHQLGDSQRRNPYRRHHYGNGEGTGRG